MSFRARLSLYPCQPTRALLLAPPHSGHESSRTPENPGVKARMVGFHPRPAPPRAAFLYRGGWERKTGACKSHPPFRAGVAARKLKSKMKCSLLIAAPRLPSAPIGIFQLHVSGSLYQLSRTAVTRLREGCTHLPGSGGHPAPAPHRYRTRRTPGSGSALQQT